MELEDSYKLQVLKEIVQKNINRIEEIEDIERELALSRWLHDSFEEMSFGKPEFRDIFHREMHSLRKTLHQLDARYTENKFDLEKKRIIRQNYAIETFLFNTFAIDIDMLIGRKKPAPAAEMPHLTAPPVEETAATPTVPLAEEAAAAPAFPPVEETAPPPSLPPEKQKQALPQEPVEEMILPPDKDTQLFPSFTGNRPAKQKPMISKISIPVDTSVQVCEKPVQAEKKISAEELISAQKQGGGSEETLNTGIELPEEKSPETAVQLEEQQVTISERIELITSIDMPPDPALDHLQESCEEKTEEKASEQRETIHRHRKVEKLNLNLPSRTKNISFMKSGT
ncbi:MAG: hypothetical protein AB2L14_00505 [Candidatus Xenobiia bacterium LiM19]